MFFGMCGGYWRPALAAGLLAVLTGLLAGVWRLSGLNDAAALATVFAAVLTVAVPVVPWALKGVRSETAGPDELASRLAATVRRQWEQEADIRQIRDPQPLIVRWAPSRPALMDWPEVVGVTRPSLTGGVDQVLERFIALPGRRLVIIGQPGAGKTGALLLLTLALLGRRELADAVPVLLTLSSWNPRVETFPAWLSRHLADEYPFLRRSGAEALVASNRVLPILDGLDELPTGVPAAALLALNEAGTRLPLVLASRSAEFTEAVACGDVLTGAAVVELEPIPARSACDYLRLTTPRDDRGDRWEPVFAELRGTAGTPVAAALSTPLMLSLARSVYSLDRAVDPAELVDRRRFPTREDVEGYLLDALVPAVFDADRQRRDGRWTPGQARRWLTFLAWHLRERDTRDLAWWELWRPRTVGGFAYGLAAGLLSGLLGGLVIGLAVQVPGNPAMLAPDAEGIALGAGMGLGVGLMNALVYMLRDLHLTMRAVRFLQLGQGMRSLGIGLVVVYGLGGGLALGFLSQCTRSGRGFLSASSTGRCPPSCWDCGPLLDPPESPVVSTWP
jgi:NACHT domain